jgi:hypothetical protein
VGRGRRHKQILDDHKEKKEVIENWKRKNYISLFMENSLWKRQTTELLIRRTQIFFKQYLTNALKGR